MIKVLSFDKQVHDLNELKQMTDSERMELAEMGVMQGDNDVAICTLQEFQNYYNTEQASPKHSYIFFLEEKEPLARFNKNERVFVCTYGTDHGWGIVDKETEVFTHSDKVSVILDNGQPVEERGVCIYRLTRDMCPNCGRLLCAEVDTELGYSHYCPSCDENYYESEIIESV